MIGDIFPEQKRSRAMGIFMLGFSLGILLCFLILGQMVKATGNWLLPFYIAAAPGILIALIILFVSEYIRL
jgi:MFS family permease